MAFTAGQKLTAAQLNNITPFFKTANMSGASQTATTTPTDLAGATVTFTAPVANTQALVYVNLDAEQSGVGDILIGTVQLDGVTQTGEMHSSGACRANIEGKWLLSGLSAGSHTVKVRLSKALVSGVNCVVYGSGHSKITVQGNGIS